MQGLLASDDLTDPVVTNIAYLGGSPAKLRLTFDRGMTAFTASTATGLTIKQGSFTYTITNVSVPSNGATTCDVTVGLHIGTPDSCAYDGSRPDLFASYPDGLFLQPFTDSVPFP